jgi:acetyl esterase/lipase
MRFCLSFWQVVEYLHLEHGINRVALWGRSMGAVSALLFAQAPLYALIRPDALVLDSPFCSFPRLVDDLIKKGALRIPRIAVKTVLSMVRSSVKKRTGADVYKLEPIKGCSSAAMPALFVTADHDEMIPVEHGAALNDQWSGPSLQVCAHRWTSMVFSKNAFAMRRTVTQFYAFLLIIFLQKMPMPYMVTPTGIFPRWA